MPGENTDTNNKRILVCIDTTAGSQKRKAFYLCREQSYVDDVDRAMRHAAGKKKITHQVFERIHSDVIVVSELPKQ